MISCSVLLPDEAPRYSRLTFPLYRNALLDLGSNASTVAVGADVLGAPWALALGHVTRARDGLLLSIAVTERARRRGIATQLMVEIEQALRARGVERLVTSYRADRPHGTAVARLLERRGFQHPANQSIVELRYRLTRLLEAPALNVPCPGAEVVPFSTDRLAPLMLLEEDSGLSPAKVSPDTSDPTLATLITMHGKVAACVLGYRADAETGHIRLLFVRRELRRGGLGAFATRCFVLRLLDLGLTHLSCEVRLSDQAWLPFADGKLGPVADSRLILRSAHKLF